MGPRQIVGRPLLTIVSVTYRDLPGVRRTLASIQPLLSSAGTSIECIVKDGGTPDFTDQLGPVGQQVRVLSSSDRGTYDAMNLALHESRGDYIWFLNGGDECVAPSWEFLRDSLEHAHGKMILFDYLRSDGSADVLRRSRSAQYIWHALPTCHQAIIYPGKPARQVEYDLSFAMSADYQFTAVLLHAGLDAQLVHTPIARFHVGGFSTRRRDMIALDAARVQREILRTPSCLRVLSGLRHGLVRTMRAVQEWRTISTTA